MPIDSNRALYLELMGAVGRRQPVDRSLADFLIGLRQELGRHRGASALTPVEFAAAIVHGLDGELLPIEPAAWRSEDLSTDEADDAPVGFDDVDRTLRSQILELLDALESGDASHDYRSFGLDVTRQGTGQRSTSSYWYNWDLAAFVECGLVGSFGGWEPGDEGGRELVSGDVAVIGDDGEITSAAPEDLVEAPQPLVEVTWSDVADFLWAGQMYE